MVASVDLIWGEDVVFDKVPLGRLDLAQPDAAELKSEDDLREQKGRIIQRTASPAREHFAIRVCPVNEMQAPHRRTFLPGVFAEQNFIHLFCGTILSRAFVKPRSATCEHHTLGDFLAAFDPFIKSGNAFFLGSGSSLFKGS